MLTFNSDYASQYTQHWHFSLSMPLNVINVEIYSDYAPHC